MNITVSDLITKCQKRIPDLGQRVENNDWYSFFTEAIREVRSGRTFPWQRRTTTMEFFTDIFEYVFPDDFESPIKPHKDLLIASDSGPYLLYGRDKDFFAGDQYKLAIKWEREKRTLLARQDSDSMVLMDGFGDDVSEYDLTGDASNPVSDSVRYKEGAASLRFDITDSTNLSIISRVLGSSIDLTEYLNKGYAFLWVYMPTVLTSVGIRYGNDASNYYQITGLTTDFFGDSFSTGWNLIQFDLKNASTVGSPDISDIDYYAVLLDNTGVTDTDFRIDAFTFHIPSLLEMPYNSKNVVKDDSGTYKESVTADTDIILSEECFESVFMYEAIEQAAIFKLRDTDLATVASSLKAKKLIELNNRYPSVEAKAQSNYYSRNNDI